MKKLLLVANVSKEHIRKFHIPFILRMKELGWRVDVACRLDEPVPECDNAYDLPCDRNPFRGGLSKSVKLLQQVIQQNRYDLICCNTITGSIVARLSARSFRPQGLKVIYIDHGLHFFKGAPAHRWIMGYPMEKALAPLTDVMVTINSVDYATARTYLGIKNVERIHGIGVDLQRFRECRLSSAEWLQKRRSLGLSGEDFIMTYVAEIIDNKNQQLLLQLLELILPAIPNAKLMLIGPEHDGGKIRAMVQKQGLSDRVLLTGWRDDIPHLLRISDVYTASSKSEGLPLNLIEAMACDLPVVACKNRGHSEIILHGENGFLVEQGDSAAMAARVFQLAKDPSLKQKIVHQAQLDITQYETTHVLDELTEIMNRYVKQDRLTYEKTPLSDP